MHPAPSHSGVSSVAPSCLPLHESCDSHEVVECGLDSPQRGAAESLVRRAFAAKHGADVHSFMPTLFALRGHRGRFCSVAGFRDAASGPLFLERYLRNPVQQELSCKLDREISRDDIVEVGNLAGSGCGAAYRLALLLPSLLLSRGKRWLVFTATDAVRQMLERQRAPLFELAAADARCVAGGIDNWGSYYDNDPRVLAGYLPDGLKLALAGARA